MSVSVEKHRGVIARGYRDAVSRLRHVHDARDHDGVYIAVTEATNWLASLALQTDLSGHEDVDALIFARHRSHHQVGSITYFDGDQSVYRWRPASQLPVAEDPRYRHEKLEKKYVARLSGEPLLDVFDRLGAVRF